MRDNILHDKIYEMLIEKDEVTWQSILYDLVRTEQMDPWNIDVSKLANKYLKALKTMKKHDFRISGKVILAAAILLKIQSKRLVGDDIGEFDRLIAGDVSEQFLQPDEFYESLESGEDHIVYEVPELIPKTPQPRKRKVSIYDLVKALQKALEVKKRRVFRQAPPDVHVPKKKRDITLVIRDIYGTITEFFSTKPGPLYVSHIIPAEADKETKVFSFIPLLHLTTQQKIDLAQKQHFGDIEILLPGTERIKTVYSEIAQEEKQKEVLEKQNLQEKKERAKKRKLAEKKKLEKRAIEPEEMSNAPDQSKDANLVRNEEASRQE